MNTQISTHMDLRWSVRFSASCLHAAEAVAQGRLVVDSRMAEAVTQPAQQLSRAIASAGLPRAQFWRNLIGLSVTVDGSGPLALRAATKIAGANRAEGIAPNLAGWIAALESAVGQTFPTLQDDVTLQIRRMRQQWDGRGPGLLRRIALWTDPRLIVPEASVVLAYPSLDGGGSAHLPFRNVLIEGVPADPVPELPEVLRLVWLLTQLNLDIPVYSEGIHGNRLPHIAELAMLPATLKAAEECGLLEFDPTTLDQALKSWHVTTPADVDPVEILWRWWGTYLETRPRWDVAFTALDRMFG